jgi:hypothetical protein
MLYLFLIINLRPGVAGAKVVWLAVFRAHRMVIFNAIREEEFRRSFADPHHGATVPRGGLPPQKSVSWRYVSSSMSLCCSILMSMGFPCE